MRRVQVSCRGLFIAAAAVLLLSLWGCMDFGAPTPTPGVPSLNPLNGSPTAGTAGVTPTTGGEIEGGTPTTAGTLTGRATADASSTPQAGITNATPAVGNNNKVVQEGTTQHYKLTLRIGPVQPMLTLQQAQNATSGQVMVNGEAQTSDVLGKEPNYQLEVAVSDIASGAVLTNKAVSINLTNVATNEKIHVIPAVMYDVAKGPSDMHFGNNVALGAGNYIADIRVGDEAAAINFTAPIAEGTPFTMGTPGSTGTTPTP